MPAGAPSAKFPQFSLLELDLGFGEYVTQSSALSSEYRAIRLYPPARDREFFFHTSLETNPWILIDLGILRTLGRLTVWNRRSGRPEFLARALPLLVSLSADGSVWTDSIVWQEAFDGPEGAPLSIDWAFGIKARYIRLSVKKETYLHLYYVQVGQFAPRMQWGSMVNLRKSSSGDVACDYLLSFNHGLYANMSTALQDLSDHLLLRNIGREHRFLHFLQGLQGPSIRRCLCIVFSKKYRDLRPAGVGETTQHGVSQRGRQYGVQASAVGRSPQGGHGVLRPLEIGNGPCRSAAHFVRIKCRPYRSRSCTAGRTNTRR